MSSKNKALSLCLNSVAFGILIKTAEPLMLWTGQHILDRRCYISFAVEWGKKKTKHHVSCSWWYLFVWPLQFSKQRPRWERKELLILMIRPVANEIEKKPSPARRCFDSLFAFQRLAMGNVHSPFILLPRPLKKRKSLFVCVTHPLTIFAPKPSPPRPPPPYAFSQATPSSPLDPKQR